MATRLENAAKKDPQMKICTQGCPGELRTDTITRVFERRGSLIEVIVESIPASICTICGHAFFSEIIAQQVDDLLAPFHGKGGNVPKLPPARVIVDFAEARKRAA